MSLTDPQTRYVNFYTDFAFKKLFGTEANKDLLLSFLNSCFEGTEHFLDITYLNTENLGVTATERRAVFDVYCETEKGEKILIEMQNGEQQFFKDRSIFYSTFPIREQAKQGKSWDYELKRSGLSAQRSHHLLQTVGQRLRFGRKGLGSLAVPDFNGIVHADEAHLGLYASLVEVPAGNEQTAIAIKRHILGSCHKAAQGIASLTVEHAGAGSQGIHLTVPHLGRIEHQAALENVTAQHKPRRVLTLQNLAE